MDFGTTLTRPQSQEQIAVTTIAHLIFAKIDAMGLRTIPADTLGTVMNETMKAISPEQLASIKPGDSNLAAIVNRSMDTALSGFSDTQKKAMQPNRDPQNGADGTGANAGFFGPDAFGRIGWDRKIGAVGGAYAANSSGGSSYGYAGMTARWDPSTGGAGLSEKNFSDTPFQQAGLDLGTTRSLFAKGFNQQQILAAANDTKALGFSPHDKEIIQNQATIRKLDNKPEETNKALQSFNRLEEQHKEELRELLRRRDEAKTPEAKAAAQKAIDEHHKKMEERSHLGDRYQDPANKEPSKKAAKGTESAMKRRLERQLGHEKSVTHKKRAAADATVAKAEVKANQFAALMAADQSLPPTVTPTSSPTEKPVASPSAVPQEKQKSRTQHAGHTQTGVGPKLS